MTIQNNKKDNSRPCTCYYGDFCEPPTSVCSSEKELRRLNLIKLRELREPKISDASVIPGGRLKQSTKEQKDQERVDLHNLRISEES